MTKEVQVAKWDVLLQGAVLMIGSLYWETELNALKPDVGKLREEWRVNNFAMDKAQWIECPIRYGRLSSSREKTYTMMFSTGVPASGKAPIIPYINKIAVDKEFTSLYNQAHNLAYVEGMIKADGTVLLANWGTVALYINPRFVKQNPEMAEALKKSWISHFANLKPASYRMNGMEEKSVNEGALVNFPIIIPDEIDYVFCTPVTPNTPEYPSSSEIAGRINESGYKTYLAKNIESGIQTFQDEEIVARLSDEITNVPKPPSVPLSFKKYARTQSGLMQFRTDLIRKLGKGLFVLQKKNLCYQMLTVLDAELSNAPQYDDTAIDLACGVILEKFKTHFGDYSITLSEPVAGIKEDFLFHLLDLEKIPGDEKPEIEVLIKADLVFINDRVKMYESMKPIQEATENMSPPRNHDERTVYDFYKRCLIERQNILDYYLNDFEERVLAKCRIRYLRFENEFEWYRDRPYTLSIPGSRKYFDHRLIDACRHRIKNVLLSESKEFTKLYTTNKEEFYIRLQTRQPYNRVWTEIQNLITFVPEDNPSRKGLFQELERLFNERKWYGFYALALSQIEGLFTEMAKMCNPKGKFAALPDKVSAVRKYYSYATNYLDYYQYHVPSLRNKFMHSGMEEGLELKSYDLLYDLQHLLEVYIELKTPLQELTNMINHPSLGLFFRVADFSHYFNLVNQVKTDRQLEKIEQKIIDFEKSFIMQQADPASLFSEIEIDIKKSFDHYYKTVRQYTDANRKQIDLFAMTEFQVTKSKDDITSSLVSFYNYYQDIFDNIEDHMNFSIGYQIWLPSMDTDTKKKFGDLYKLYESDFKKFKNVLSYVRPANSILD